jgi:hypothetical protein
MNNITKQNFLNQLQINTDLLMKNFIDYSVDNKTTDFTCLLRNNKGESIANISFNVNCGDIRSIKLFVFTKNEKKNNANFMIELEDKSIGCGKYTSIWNSYLGSPLAMQISSFDTMQSKKMVTLENKKTTMGTEIEFMVEVDAILQPLYDLFYRTEDTLSDYYTEKNIESNSVAFAEYQKKDNLYKTELLLTDTIAQTAVFQSSNYFHR